MNFDEQKKIIDAKNFVFDQLAMSSVHAHLCDKECSDAAIKFLTDLFDMGGMYQKLLLQSYEEIKKLKDSVEYFQKENGKLQETINFNDGNN